MKGCHAYPRRVGKSTITGCGLIAENKINARPDLFNCDTCSVSNRIGNGL